MAQWSNRIFQGDCIKAIEAIKEELDEAVRVIYLDPPFFTGTNYSIKKKGKGSAEIAPKLSETETYSDKWSGGLREYLDFMEKRLEAMVPLLREDGSLWVHLDWHVCHYVKTILDDILGYNNFVNEIIWRRTNSPKSQSRGFGSQHDVILLYAKKAAKFQTKQVYRPHDKRSLKPYSYEDERGRFRLIEIEAQGIQRTEGRKQFEWRGRTAPYLYRRETLDKWWNDGLIYTSKNGRFTKKQYLDDVPGVVVSDLWFDLAPVQGASKEYTGFLTQKPESLLKRIIESASDPGDIIADFFGGSGTTAVAAALTSRRWILVDDSSTAIEVSRKRLGSLVNRPDSASCIRHIGYELIDLT